MGRLGTQAVYASPGQSPARTQDSLPAVGQTLPGGLDGPLGSSERFRAVSYISPPFPGLSWRKRAAVRRLAVEKTEAGKGKPRKTAVMIPDRLRVGLLVLRGVRRGDR